MSLGFFRGRRIDNHLERSIVTQDLEAQGRNPLNEASSQRVTTTKRACFRENAKVWQLYLQDSEEEAGDKANLWKTGLDSFLLFAGLFAGVVSSFVIDARRDQQPDTEPRLLTDILDILRNSPTGQTVGIPNSIYWVNGLWMMSLFLTIFSAIMGVLAKAWLAKYTPAKNRGQAYDAYRRYQLDRQSERWFLHEALLMVPLLVQMATFLFLAGLVIQVIGDNAIVGLTLLCFCLTGGLIYFAMTIMPLFTPASPFGTPLLDLVDAIYARNTDNQDRFPFTANIEDGLKEVLHQKLILSGKESLIDGAIAEVARPGFSVEWTGFLSTCNHTPQVLLSRFQEWMESRTSNAAQRNEALGSNLLALLSFVELYDANLAKDASCSKRYQKLDEVLRRSLQPHHPLDRWDKLPDNLRPLSFALRANIMMLLRSSPQPTSLGGNKGDFDFALNELADRPWEMASQDIPPAHHIHFTLAACQGLVHRESRIQTVSSHILCLSIAKATLINTETGNLGEWSGSLRDRADTYSLSAEYLSRLFDATVAGWETMTDDAMRALLSVELTVEVTDIQRPRATVPRNLVASLEQANHAYLQVTTSHNLKIHAIRMLKQILCRPGGPTDVEFWGIATESVRSIASMVLKDDEDVRADGLDLLTELSMLHDKVKDKTLARTLDKSLRDALTASIESGLAKSEDRQLATTIQFIEKLSAHESPFVSVIDDVVPRLIEVALDDARPEQVWQTVIKLLQRLSSDKRLSGVKDAVLRRHVEAFERHESVRYTFLHALQSFFKASDLPRENERLFLASLWSTPGEFVEEVIGKMFPNLVEVAISDEYNDDTAQELLTLVASDDRFTALQPDVMNWLDTYTKQGSQWWVRVNTVMIVEIFAVHRSVHTTAELVRHLLRLALRDDKEDVRKRALKAATTLCQDDKAFEKFSVIVRDTIVSDSPNAIIATERYNNIKNRWVPFVIRIAKHVSFPESIPFLVDSAVSANDRSAINPEIMEFLESKQFAEVLTYRDAFKKVIPQSLQAALPTVEDQPDRRNWIRLLLDLRPIDSLSSIADEALAQVLTDVKLYANSTPPELSIGAPQAGIDNATAGPFKDNTFPSKPTLAPSLQHLLGRTSWQGRAHWVEILGRTAEQVPHEVLKAVEIIIHIAVHDPDYDVREVSVKTLTRLAKRDANRGSLLADVEDHVQSMAKDGRWSVRLAVARLLATFAGLKGCTLPEKAKQELIRLAAEDEDERVRSQSIDSLSIVLSNEGSPQLFKNVSAVFEAGKEHVSPALRRSWVKLIAACVKDAGSRYLRTIFDVAVKDGIDDVRDEASNGLVQLLKTASPEESKSMAAKIGRYLTSAIKNPEVGQSAKSLLTRLTSFFTYGDRTTEPGDWVVQRQETWVQVTCLLGQNGEYPTHTFYFQGVPQIIQMAILDAVRGEIVEPETQFQRDKRQHAIVIDTVLPELILSALKSDRKQDRSAAVGLSARLLCPGPDATHGIGGRQQEARPHRTKALEPANYQVLLGTTHDSQLATQWSEISIRDDDFNLRQITLKLLKSLLYSPRFKNVVNTSLSRALKACFDEQELAKFVKNAVETLQNLSGDPDGCDKFKDIVSPSIPRLMRLTMVAGRGAHELRKVAEIILLENITGFPFDMTPLSREVLYVLPTMIPEITPVGRRIALQFTETINLSDDAASSFAHTLTPLLGAASSLSQGTALELLSKLYSKHTAASPKPRLVECLASAIQEITALALDKKAEVSGTRTAAVKLLVALCGGSRPMVTENGAASSNEDSPLKQLAPLASKFMGLIKNGHLKPADVELLSLMSAQSDVRRMISLSIIRSAFVEDSVALKGHAMLLARLITDGRFADETTDNVVLFLASSLLTKPELSSYRFDIATALWCRYRKKTFDKKRFTKGDKAMENFVELFVLALFGRHARGHEYKRFLDHGERWIAQEPMADTVMNIGPK